MSFIDIGELGNRVDKLMKEKQNLNVLENPDRVLELKTYLEDALSSVLLKKYVDLTQRPIPLFDVGDYNMINIGLRENKLSLYERLDCGEVPNYSVLNIENLGSKNSLNYLDKKISSNCERWSPEFFRESLEKVIFGGRN